MEEKGKLIDLIIYICNKNHEIQKIYRYKRYVW